MTFELSLQAVRLGWELVRLLCSQGWLFANGYWIDLAMAAELVILELFWANGICGTVTALEKWSSDGVKTRQVSTRRLLARACLTAVGQDSP